MSKSDAGYQRSVCYTENAGLSKSNVRFHRTAGYSITRKMIIQDREGMGRNGGGGEGDVSAIQGEWAISDTYELSKE